MKFTTYFPTIFTLQITVSEQIPTARMGKGATSSIWEFYDKTLADPGHAVCKKCKKKVSRGSHVPAKMNNTNLKNHLRVQHGDLYDQVTKKDDEIMRKKEKLKKMSKVVLLL